MSVSGLRKNSAAVYDIPPFTATDSASFHSSLRDCRGRIPKTKIGHFIVSSIDVEGEDDPKLLRHYFSFRPSLSVIREWFQHVNEALHE